MDGPSGHVLALRAKVLALRAKLLTLRVKWMALRAKLLALRAKLLTLRVKWMALRAMYWPCGPKVLALRAKPLSVYTINGGPVFAWFSLLAISFRHRSSFRVEVVSGWTVVRSVFLVGH